MFHVRGKEFNQRKQTNKHTNKRNKLHYIIDIIMVTVLNILLNVYELCLTLRWDTSTPGIDGIGGMYHYPHAKPHVPLRSEAETYTIYRP